MEKKLKETQLSRPALRLCPTISRLHSVVLRLTAAAVAAAHALVTAAVHPTAAAAAHPPRTTSAHRSAPLKMPYQSYLIKLIVVMMMMLMTITFQAIVVKLDHETSQLSKSIKRQ